MRNLMAVIGVGASRFAGDDCSYSSISVLRTSTSSSFSPLALARISISRERFASSRSSAYVLFHFHLRHVRIARIGCCFLNDHLNACQKHSAISEIHNRVYPNRRAPEPEHDIGRPRDISALEVVFESCRAVPGPVNDFEAPSRRISAIPGSDCERINSAILAFREISRESPDRSHFGTFLLDGQAESDQCSQNGTRYILTLRLEVVEIGYGTHQNL